MSQFGLTEWDNVEVKANNNNANRVQNRDLYMKLQNGSNVLRVVTKPHEYEVHTYKAHPDDQGFGTRILSSKNHPEAGGRDPLVEAGVSKPKRRWLVGVIDRKTSSYKLLDLSVSALKGIQALVRDEDWGDPTQYDIDIKVDKQGGPTGYYAVIAKPKKPLSAADLEIKQQIDLEDLKRRCTPLSYDQASERMRAVQAKSPNFGKGESAAPADTSEDDTDFPVANE